MSKFRDFVKKNEEGLQKQKEDKQAKNTAAKEYSEAIDKAVPIEWAKVFPATRAITDGETFDNKKFIPNGDSSLMLGATGMALMRRYGHGTGKHEYGVDYKIFSAGAFTELSSVNIEPILSGADILWKVGGLNQPDPLSTIQLAEALARKLVDVYQDNLI